MTTAGKSEGRRVAVVVVHGVGNNAPGSTVNSVVNAVCAGPETETSLRDSRRDNATPENDVYMFAEPTSDWQRTVEKVIRKDTGATRAAPVITDAPRHDVPRFPVYGRQAALPNGGTAEFFELHWADLARSDGGWWSTVRSFSRFVFEIPHVIDGFLRDPPGPYSRFLRRLLLLATCFVRGPLAGYTAVMLAGGLIYLSFSWIPEREGVATVVFLAQERLHDLLAVALPSFAFQWINARYAQLPQLPSRTWMLAILTGLMVLGLVVAWLRRKSVRALFASAFLVLTAGFYLFDALHLRPDRYAAYVGIVYLDYMSVILFAICMSGLYMFVTRRRKEVGFADLGLFIGIWSAYFIAHMSALGDAIREHWFKTKPIFETTVATPSSKVHFEAFSLYYPMLAHLWVIWGALMLAAFTMTFLLYVFNWRVWNSKYRGVFAALGLAVVQSCVWLTAIPGLGVMHMDDVLCRGANNYASIPKEQPVSCQHKLEVNGKAVDLLLRLHVLDDASKSALPPYLRSEIEEAVRERFPRTLDLEMLKAMQELALAFIWNGFVLITAGFLAVVVAFYRHVIARWFGSRNQKVRLPRLIINKGVLGFLIALGVVNIAFAFTRLNTHGPIHDALWNVGLSAVQQRDVPAEVVKMAILTTSLALLITQIPSIMTPLSGVLQIMQGLIDHHYRVGVSLAPRLMAKRSEVPIRRDHITQRMHEIVTRMIALKGYDDVVFLAHSQGSIIVYDYLSSPAAQVIGKPVHVVTVGSPLGAVYAYYFNEYDKIEQRIGKLGTTTASWTNLYRLDDPIAGPIVPRRSSARRAANPAPPPSFLHDEQLPPGGHLRYWQEPVVCDTIRNLLLGRPPRSCQPGPSALPAPANPK